MDQWWAPEPWKARTKSMDFTEGGSWLYAMVGPNGEEHWSFTTYEIIVLQQRFTGRDGFSDENGVVNAALPQSAWDVRFTPLENSTRVQLLIRYPNLEQLEKTLEMGFQEGISKAMEGLDQKLEPWQKPTA